MNTNKTRLRHSGLCRSYLSGAILLASLVVMVAGGCADDEETPDENVAPTANAGANQAVNGQAVVVLDGSGSFDSDGSIVSYSWVQASGSAVAVADADSSVASFTAPTLDENETLVFELTVTDDDGASASSSVNITIEASIEENLPPVANAGGDQMVDELTAVIVDGSASVDEDGSIVTYAWVQTSGTEVTLMDADASVATFTAPALTNDDTLTFELTVTDDDGASTKDSVSVEVKTLVETGYFSFGPVRGLSYETESLSGQTDEDGAYQYRPGESITFSVGDTTLGETVAANQELTPFDLVTGSTIYTKTTQLEALLANGREERDAFFQVHNVLAFLLALDSDGDFTNGIAIAPGVATLLAGIQIDFSVNYRTFDRSPGLQFLLHGALEAGYLDTVSIAADGRAFDEFYEFYGITTYFKVPQLQSYDDDGDGSADNIRSYTLDGSGDLIGSAQDQNANNNAERTSVFDGEGKRLTLSQDLDDDGTLDRVTTYAYDDFGRTTVVSRTNGDGSSLETREAWSYNAFGSVVSYTRDSNGDGTPDQIDAYTYNAAGNLLTYSRDADGDGNPNRVETYTYDAAGNPLTYSLDSNGDGSAERTTTYTYDAAGNVLSETEDSDGDGSPDSSENYTYDSAGNVLTATGANGDGTVVFWHDTYTYDAEGNLAGAEYDWNGDGTVDETEAYTYDVDGRLLSETTSDSDGNPLESNTYTYDADGNRLSRAIDSDGDGFPNRTWAWTYDSEGNLLTTRVDSDGDGNPNSIFTNTFDADGNLVSVVSDTDGDGTADRIVAWTYDAYGNVLTRSTDNDADGTVDSTSTFTYPGTSAPISSWLIWWELED